MVIKQRRPRGSWPYTQNLESRTRDRRVDYLPIASQKRRAKKLVRKPLIHRGIDVFSNLRTGNISAAAQVSSSVCTGDSNNNDNNALPESYFRTASGTFTLPPGYSQFFSVEEKRERLRVAKIDLERHNLDYIIQIAEKCRGGVWKCKRDENVELFIGCRNYIVTLVFEDGSQWLLKVQQPLFNWSDYKTTLADLREEIATIRFVGQKTRIPVPKIHAWSLTHSRNGFGKPWYLMSKLSGNTLRRQFDEIKASDYTGEYTEDLVYKKIIEQTAHIAFQLLQLPFDVPGKLDIPAKERIRGLKTIINRSKGKRSTLILKESRSTWNYRRPLFKALTRLEEAQWKLAVYREAHWVSKSQQKKEDQLFTLAQETLCAILGPDRDINAGPFILMHGDLTEGNILVDKYFNITGIIDWECANLAHLSYAIDWFELDDEEFEQLNFQLAKAESQDIEKLETICFNFNKNLQKLLKRKSLLYEKMKELDQQEGYGLYDLALPKNEISRVFNAAGAISAIQILTSGILQTLTQPHAREIFVEYATNQLWEYMEKKQNTLRSKKEPIC